jgi:hypothetical protein
VPATAIAPVQLALRVSSTSVTVITPGAGCSITSTATVSSTGVTGGFTFRAAFFTGAGLGLALATVRFVAFAALDTLRALPRLAELRSFAGFCTFDVFLRLAMIDPLVVCPLQATRTALMIKGQTAKSRHLIQRVFKLECDCARALFFVGGTGRPKGDEVI